MRKKPLTTNSGEVHELTSEDIRAMKPASEILPSKWVSTLPKRKRGQRGVQKHPKKIAITLRYSPEVVEYFKATGAGWQARMDEALREWIKKHPQRAA